MSRLTLDSIRPAFRGRLLIAALAALAVVATGCGSDDAGTPAAAAPGTTDEADDGTAPGGDPAPAAEWLTQAERDAQAAQYPDVTWLAATFLAESADEPVAATEQETRYIAFVPPEGQLDIVPAAEAFTLLHGASPDGLQNALSGLEIQLFGFAIETAGERSVVTVDFGEGIAASRSMSSTEAQLAFNQFVGMLALHFPDADLAQVTVEGQPEPELFGGIDTTEPFTIRQ